MEKEAKKRKAKVYEKDKLFRKMGKQRAFFILLFVMLSSRTKDENTIKAMENLYNSFPSPQQLANAKIRDIEKAIRGVGFYRVKAKRVKQIAEYVEKHGVPENKRALLSLPGVGEKTANVFLAEAFGKPFIGVDVHLHRIINRLGLISTKKPLETSKLLNKVVKQSLKKRMNKAFVGYGQVICKAKPLCSECKIKSYCNYYKKKQDNSTS